MWDSSVTDSRCGDFEDWDDWEDAVNKRWMPETGTSPSMTINLIQEALSFLSCMERVGIPHGEAVDASR